MSIGINIDVSLWKKMINSSIIKIENASDNTIKTVAKRLKDKIEEYTPIGNPSLWKWPAHKDYSPGSLKANWILSYQGKETIISNFLPYALRVEFGWSTQAPEGMMRRAILEYPILIDRTSVEYKL